MPHTADTMGLIHKPGTGPNNRFGFKNHSNNRANEIEKEGSSPMSLRIAHVPTQKLPHKGHRGRNGRPFLRLSSSATCMTRIRSRLPWFPPSRMLDWRISCWQKICEVASWTRSSRGRGVVTKNNSRKYVTACVSIPMAWREFFLACNYPLALLDTWSLFFHQCVLTNSAHKVDVT